MGACRRKTVYGAGQGTLATVNCAPRVGAPRFFHVKERTAMPGKSQIVFVVDRDPNRRESMTSLLADMGMSVRSMASFEEFIDKYSRGDPCCVVMSVPQAGGVNGKSRRTKAKKACCYLVIGGCSALTIRRVLKQGAVSCVSHAKNDRSIAAAIQKALTADRQGQRESSHVDEIADRIASLLPEERVVADLLMKGKTSKAIAMSLDVSRRTIERRVSRVLRKMEAETLAQVALMMSEYERALGNG